MLIYVLYALFILSCIVLILSVLLQPGKADAGSLFTSSFSSTAFGPRGTQTLLAKISIGAAAAFMLLALLISMGVGGYRSVISSDDTTPPAQTAPAAPATAPAGEEAAPQEGTETQPQTAAPTEQQPGAAVSASPAAAPAQPAASPGATR